MRDKREFLDPDSWNVIDQRSGFKKKASEVQKQWDGRIVSREEFETRHPQDLVKAVRDVQVVRDVRPEPTDRFVDDITDPDNPSFIDYLATEDGEQFITEGLVNEPSIFTCLVTE